jgi:hypothetical protein
MGDTPENENMKFHGFIILQTTGKNATKVM